MASPLPLSALYDLLPISTVAWSIQRNDELSGSGDGRVWQAQLAPPIWKAEINLAAIPTKEMRSIVAKLRSLNGASRSFLCCDPAALYPAEDCGGAIIASHTVLIAAIANRRSITLSGLPPGYTLEPGDKFSAAFDPASPTELQPWLWAEGVWNDGGFWHDSNSWDGASGDLKYAFHEVSEPAMADEDGIISLRVFPNLPFWVGVGMSVRLCKPNCPVIIVPGTLSEGTASGNQHTEGVSFSVVQKK